MFSISSLVSAKLQYIWISSYKEFWEPCSRIGNYYSEVSNITLRYTCNKSIYIHGNQRQIKNGLMSETTKMNNYF